MAACFDAMIIDKYDGTKGLDDFMQVLYAKFYIGLNRGFSELEFQEELESFLSQDLDQFFSDYIYGTKIPDYNAIFSKIGVAVQYTGREEPSLGASIVAEGAKMVVKSVRAGSAAEEGGLSVNDEIVGCNGFRMNTGTLSKLTASITNGELVNLLVSRDEILLELKVRITNYEKAQYRFIPIESHKTERLKMFWLRSN